MSLSINNNIPGINANRNLLGANRKANDALAKLSSGFRINQGKDGPAALIISELLRSQMSGFSQAIRNTQEANNVLGIAEGGLSEISNQLNKMRGLAIHALNSGITSGSQISADQAELNSSINAISRMANTTNFAGEQLLNGAQDITFNANDPDSLLNLNATTIDEAADISGQNVSIDFAGGAANQAEKAHIETNLGGGTALADAQEFTLTGTAGTANFSFAAGTDITAMADTINNRSEQTGVTAYAINGDTELRLVSNEYGAGQSVQVEQEVGSAFAAAGSTSRDEGQDASLTIDGEMVSTDGLSANIAGGSISGTIAFAEGTVAATTIAQTGYDQDVLTDATASRSAHMNNITGGMRFQLGEGAGTQNRDVFSVQSFDPANLGQVTVNGQNLSLSDLMSGGDASLAVDPAAALKVIDQAINDVASGRARIGAYQANTLQSNVNQLGIALENVTATESAIRDTDMAKQISELVKAQLLEKTGLMSVQSSNMQAGNVLKLLGS